VEVQRISPAAFGACSILAWTLRAAARAKA
jgi:hypothetical protein